MTQVTLSRRRILAGIGALGVAGCAGKPGEAGFILSDLARVMRGAEDVYPESDAAILASPHAQLGVRVAENAPGIFQLVGQGAARDFEYQWLTGGPILLVTHHGRIRATRGFTPELTALQFHGQDPLISVCAELTSPNARQSTRFVFRDETDHAVFDEQVAKLSWVGESQITLLGSTYRCEHWQETVTTLPSRKQHENHFHVHKASGHVLESLQKPFHDSPVIRTQLLKAPGPGPRT